MGNQATTTRTPTADQSASNTHSDIHTQAGKNNFYYQDNAIVQGLGHIYWYIFIVVILFVVIIAAALIRYINSALKKRIDRRI